MVHLVAHLEVAGSTVEGLALGHVVDEERTHQGQASASCLQSLRYWLGFYHQCRHDRQSSGTAKQLQKSPGNFVTKGQLC